MSSGAPDMSDGIPQRPRLRGYARHTPRRGQARAGWRSGAGGNRGRGPVASPPPVAPAARVRPGPGRPGRPVHSGHGRRPGRARSGGAADHVVVVLLDSLNRHMLGSYGAPSSPRPTSTASPPGPPRFTNHVTGSLPCMPARHDILCGALDFLWKPWGSIELWERPITADLRGRGGHHHAGQRPPAPVRDRRRELPHRLRRLGLRAGPRGRPLAHPRGHVLGGHAGPAGPGRGWFFRKTWGDEVTTGPTTAPARSSGPRTTSRAPHHGEAAEWLRRARRHHDRWLLFVDEFDPHEPFDTPAPWLGRYEDEPWDGDLVIWPPYAVGGVARGC